MLESRFFLFFDLVALNAKSENKNDFSTLKSPNQKIKKVFSTSEKARITRLPG